MTAPRSELLASEVVPGDIVEIEPGDQLVGDGEVVSSRGMTMDESVLTGEADGVRKGLGDRALSGSFCVSGSGYYLVDAVREQSYAGRIAGEARTFRHPPSPLQEEVNRVILACTYLMIPLAILLIVALQVRQVGLTEAAQTATAGLITLIPEGLVLLMSVTFAVAAVRLARRGTLVQQISGTESLAAVDTICVDKTGTLTDGELELRSVEAANPSDPEAAHRALARFAASAGDRNRTLEAIAERFPARPEPVSAEVPFSSEWKWSGLTLDGGSPGASYVLGAPDVLVESGALELTPALDAKLREETRAGRRVVAFGEANEPLPEDPATAPPPRLSARALVVMTENLRPDAAETVEFMRSEEVDLKLISGDARETVTAVAYSVGMPEDAGVIEGSQLPEDPEGLAEAARRNSIFCRIKPEQKKSLVGALSDTGRYTAMIGDGVNDVPALKRARMAVAMGSGSQVTKGVADVVLLEDEFSRLPQAVAEGRRIARNVHRLGRLYLTKTVYAATLILLVGVPGFAFPFLPRHLTLAALLTIGIPSFVLALAPSDGPLYRGRLLRSLAAFAVPAGVAIGARLDPLLPAGRHDLRRLARGRPHRGDHDPDHPRPQLRAAARARPRARAHRDPELHAGDGRRPRGPVRAGAGGAAGARILRDEHPHRGAMVPGPALGCARADHRQRASGACPRSSGSRRPTSGPTSRARRRSTSPCPRPRRARGAPLAD